MSGPIQQYLEEDHRRLDALLARAMARPGEIDVEPFNLFRKGLLRHIGLEEKILLPSAARIQGTPVSGAQQLRADHGKLVAFLVPTPTPALVEQIRTLLTTHNELEERPDGVYANCERLLDAEAETIVQRFREAPEVPVRPHYDGRTPKMLQPRGV